MRTWAEHLYHYYTSLKPPKALPAGIEWLYPQQHKKVLETVKTFLDKFYSDNKTRKILLGINPGRFGAGITGVNFTAPRQLKNNLDIEHDFGLKSELSAEFIYDVIDAFGGAKNFYGRFFIGSVCPLGFVKNGKNINYYDDKELLKKVEPFIIKSTEQLVSFRANRAHCICIGGEKNYRYLQQLNDRYHWFERITAVPHPRFIMQYNRKKKDMFIELYLRELNE